MMSDVKWEMEIMSWRALVQLNLQSMKGAVNCGVQQIVLCYVY